MSNTTLAIYAIIMATLALLTAAAVARLGKFVCEVETSRGETFTLAAFAIFLVLNAVTSLTFLVHFLATL